MTSADRPTMRIDRRGVMGLGLAGGLALAAGGLTSAPAHAVPWPSAKLGAADAQTVNSSQFMSTRQLAAYGAEADGLGLRATGAANTEAYIRTLATRFRQAGVTDVRLEPVPLRRWLADSWSLQVDGKDVPDTFYAPYTQATGPAGVRADMVYVPLTDVTEDSVAGLQAAINAVNVKGKIAVFTVPYTSLPTAAFAALAYPGGVHIAPGDARLAGVYRRPWLNQVGPVLELLAKAGAVGTVGIWPDLPGKWARQYSPYDGIFRPIPSLWVDSIQGAKLKARAISGGTKATLKLQATVTDTVTHNLIGFIPGRSEELTVLHTHTDGTNGMEENGQIGILATAQYLARLPRTSLDRTVMVMLSTGHFAGGVGIRHFLDQHANDLVPRISSLLTLEHLGCNEWLPGADGTIKPTGKPELGAYFAPNSQGLVRADKAALTSTGITGVVDRPFLPAPTDPPGAKQPVGWPGEGTYWWWYGSLLNTNFITGPYGLISADLDTSKMVDYELMRKKSMVAVQTTLQLASTPTSELQTPATL
jgi:hypothetical protein